MPACAAAAICMMGMLHCPKCRSSMGCAIACPWSCAMPILHTPCVHVQRLYHKPHSCLPMRLYRFCTLAMRISQHATNPAMQLTLSALLSMGPLTLSASWPSCLHMSQLLAEHGLSTCLPMQLTHSALWPSYTMRVFEHEATCLAAANTMAMLLHIAHAADM